MVTKVVFKLLVTSTVKAKVIFSIIWWVVGHMELEKTRLFFTREPEISFFYEEYREEISTIRADFVVENKVLLGLKVINCIENVYVVQLLNAVEAGATKPNATGVELSVIVIV